MSEGRLYFLNKPYPGRPVEERYFTKINSLKEFFVTKEDALLHLFDQGIRNFQYLTKEISDYKNTQNILTYELWHVENRVGYVQYDYERYEVECGEVKKRRAFVWRFVGFGRTLFALSKEELKEKVRELIQHYNEDLDERGYNKYPFYTRHNRPASILSHGTITSERYL